MQIKVHPNRPNPRTEADKAGSRYTSDPTQHRKSSTNSPQRRREQNRRAQRNFRERKEILLKALEGEIQTLKGLNGHLACDLERQSRRVRELETLVKRRMHNLVSFQIQAAEEGAWSGSAVV
jgi:hypothetical protein